MQHEAIVDVKARIWNCWTANMLYMPDGPGYIIHMFDEDNNMERTLCGVRWQETGTLNLNETEPGCIKCRRILRKRGLLQ